MLTEEIRYVMPLKNYFLEDNIGILRVGKGMLTASEIIEANNEVLSKNDFIKNLLYCFVDLTKCTDMKASQNELKKIAMSDSQILASHNHVIVGIVAPNDLIFGLARSWQAYSSVYNYSHYVGRNMYDVEKWLKAKVQEVHGVEIKTNFSQGE